MSATPFHNFCGLVHISEIYFPQKGMRFISVNDDVDSLVEGSSDFNPIRNWANELHAKETSKKVRAVKQMQAERGERTGGAPPYGYKKDLANSKRLVPNEETTPIVQHIFQLCATGRGPSQIARQLKQEQVLTPSSYYYQKTGTALCRWLDTARPYDWSKQSVGNILENIVYLGHTLGLQTTTISYKNKTEIMRPKSEQALIENTPEPIISQELWKIVQDVRAHKRRPPKRMTEPNLFSGLIYCADCGKLMTYCRTRKEKGSPQHFRCSTYGKRGKEYCSPHQIRKVFLKQIVLDDLRRVTCFARIKMKERQFAEYINRKNSAELFREISKLQKEVDTMRRRSNELSMLFKRVYEGHVLGTITSEQFRMLSTSYNAEQQALEEAIPEKEAHLERLKASAANVENFIEKAKRYTAIKELTPELLRLFIQRIEVGERSRKHTKTASQAICIVYRVIGAVDSMMLVGEAKPYIKPPVILTGEITIGDISA